jgi:fructuronate reductase
LKQDNLKTAAVWEAAGITLPDFDWQKVAAKTKENPKWVHFGSGNLFRGYIAVLQQELLDKNIEDTGIVTVETYDYEIIDKVYSPYDNLGLIVTMYPDGKLGKKVLGSISEALVGDYSKKSDWERLKNVFRNPSLQMASFTITEKGYNLAKTSGEYFPDVLEDFKHGPDKPKNVISKVVSLAYERYLSGKYPIAFVSMDNCSHNGEKLYNSVRKIAVKWFENGYVDKGFIEYINNPSLVSFPWSMIDKITPRPSEIVRERLIQDGFEDADIYCTKKNTYIAPFVNTEEAEYLVIEDNFPNGRMELEKAGVFFTDRDTVDKSEKMKVCTCLNPLHTTLAVYGCLLGFQSIADETKDECLNKLINKVGYEEGLPVVINPGIIDPKKFIDEVIGKRFPNPYTPDTPQRIATDTSQKVSIRFGETIKAYCADPELGPEKLNFIPLVIAGWLRYLLGVDDNLNEMPLSPDPMLSELKARLKSIKLGQPETVKKQLRPILSDVKLFGLNLYEIGIAEKIENYFKELIADQGAVRATLKKYLDC